MSAAVRTVGISKSFGSTKVLEKLDLEVERGACYGLLGANGAGKTTTARLLTGVAAASAGEIFLFGTQLRGNDRNLLRRIGYLSEELALFEYLTGSEQISFAARLYGIDPAIEDGRRKELLEILDLETAADRLVAGYSYGMRKKTALAAALIADPELLVLDEPLEGVDTRSRIVIERLLADLRARGVTIFLTSNSVRLAEAICTDIGILDGGTLVAQGSLTTLLERGTDRERPLEAVVLESLRIDGDRLPKLSWA